MPERSARERTAGPARVRWAGAWLGAAFFVHCSLIVYVGLSVVGGSVRPFAVAVAAVVLTAGPLALLLWRERRDPSAARPARWTRRGIGFVPLHAVGVGIASADRLTPAGSTGWSAVVLLALVVSVVELLPVLAAGRCLRRPLSVDLGEIDVEVDVKIRPAAPWMPSWLSHHDVRLTDELLIVTVRPGPRWAYAKFIALAEIHAVDVRRAEEWDAPWFSSPEDGLSLVAPPGDIVVIRHRHGVQLLPVEFPAEFADIVRVRIAKRAPAARDRPGRR
jgi:hypothetical protein